MSSSIIMARGFRVPDKRTGNEVLNSTFDQDNYPVWASYNGLITSSGTTHSTNTFGGIASWLHYSPIFNQSYLASHIGNLFYNVHDLEPHMTDSFTAYGFPRSIKVYGAQNWYDFMSAGITNDDVQRGDGVYGEHYDGGDSRTMNHTVYNPSFTGNTAHAAATYGGTNGVANQCWTHSTAWAQNISVPDNATTCKFGGYIKVDQNDSFSGANWGGIYVAQTYTEAANTAYGYPSGASIFVRNVNYFGVRNSDQNWTLPTGTFGGDNFGDRFASMQWGGLKAGIGNSSTTIPYWNHNKVVMNQHAFLNSEDHRSFSPVEYSFTLQSGTNRDIQIGIFFAEHTDRIENNVTGNTGGFDVYDPYVEFS